MINTLFQTIYTLLNLCRFKGSPAMLPFSIMIMGILILIELGLNLYTFSQIKGVSFSENMLASILSVSLLIALIYLLFSQRKIQNRIVKVLIAWFGTELVLTILLKVILLVTPTTLQESRYILAFLQIGFFTWNIAIKAYLFKNAANMKMASALLMTFGILILSTLPVQFVLGEYLAQSLPEQS
ncbi:MAG: hypothetical protein AB7V32_05470 [Candidatus Berkiella sp.]